MAKEKKRGLFSWLGFGQKEEPQEAAPEQKMESQAVVEEQAPVEEHIAVEEHTPVEAEPHSLIESEAFAADIVDVTEKVIEREEQQADIIAEEAVVVEPEVVTEPEAVAEPDVITEPEVVVEHEELLVPEEIETVVPEPEAWLPEEDTVVADDEPEQQPQPDAIVEQEKPTKEGFFARLKRSLLKTKENLGSGFISLFRGKKIDDDLFEELEEQLLIADVGVETTRKIITNLTEGASRKQLRDAEALYGLLKDEMGDILAKVDEPLNIEGKTPFVILMVGVNGVGKTTTIGKLARQFEQQGKSVMLAAGDTFRAAAVEQLQVWGQRNNIPVIAQHTGADSASVIFDAIQAAKSRKVDVLIADTAGRLQNKAHLMEELKKIVRVMKKLDVDAPHEVMLTIDASTGQNAVSQARLFHEAVGLTGITLTKLDGTAKGGVIFSVADQFGIPIRYIGTGERIEDLRPFNAGDFIEALFARED